VQEAAYSLGVVLFFILAFAAFFVFGLAPTLTAILAVNVIFLTLTACSFTSLWPERWKD